MPEHLLDKKIVNLGNRLFEAFHLFGLFVIGAAIVWASWVEVFAIIAHAGPKMNDVLLLFIYLELGAMVGISFQTKHLHVRYLIYIAVTALTRVLAVDIQSRRAYDNAYRCNFDPVCRGVGIAHWQQPFRRERFGGKIGNSGRFQR